jgi:ABC-type glycerol-3-phosphate transport system substrate-binding protein
VVGQGHDSLGPTWAGILATEVYAKNPTWMRDRRAGKVKFASPEFIAAARKLADLASKGYINKRDVSRDYAATQQAFLDGKGAMYAMGNWFAAAADKLLISAFKLFDYVQVITKGGPGEGTTATIAFTILQVGFTANRQGYASAMAVVMLVIIAVASAVALKLLQRREVQL